MWACFHLTAAILLKIKKATLQGVPKISQEQHILPIWLAVPNANEENVNCLAVTVGTDYTNKGRLVTKPKYFRSHFRPQTPSDCFFDCLTRPKKLSNQIPTQRLPKNNKKNPGLTHCGSIRTDFIHNYTPACGLMGFIQNVFTSYWIQNQDISHTIETLGSV